MARSQILSLTRMAGKTQNKMLHYSQS